MNQPQASPPAPSRPELLAPGGEPEAAYAALHYGADAVYVGLHQFSARAEAVNFAPEELEELTAYAHSLTPARRIFVTVNTLIPNRELDELVDALAVLDDIGVDALIIQDLGVYRLARRYFPRLTLHASTQMAIHNLAGARQLKVMGFKRVTLARELTLNEVREITAHSGIETEVFIHGALCYSYSGLCFCSSMLRNRSGNRGKCTYPCREAYQVNGAPDTLTDGTPTPRRPDTGMPFSMKDLALPAHIHDLSRAGVASFKIEGRKKSPLYVAVTVDYYRRLIDGQLNRAQEAEAQARIKTVFSRPWTTLFIQSRKNPDTVDPDTVGHRGVPIGQVEYVGRAGGRHAAVRFRTARALERHDGIQIDIPGQERPFGFPVDMLRLAAAGRGQRAQSVITAPAGALVEVELPPEYPQIPIGAPVYCSSSQAIKREFRHQRPKPRLHRIREAISVSLKITPDGITARMATGAGRVCARHFPGSFQPEKVSGKTDIAARDALGKLGDTAFRLDHIELENHEDLFVPVSFLNNMRRELVAGLEAENRQYRQNRSAKIKREIAFSVRAFDPPPTNVPRWLLKVDRLALLDGMDIDELQAAEEIIIEIGQDPLADLTAGLDRLTQQMTAARIRLALPLLTRHWEEKELVEKINALRNWKKWEAANLSAWSYLAHLAPGLDLSADWTVFALNRLAAAELINAGVTRFALSPEDGSHNMREMITAYPDQAVVIVHQDTPLFIAESCAYANLIGGCPGRPRCRFKCVTMTSRAGENLTVLERNCRTIALSRTPYCISHQLDQLKPAGARWFRADFIYRPYEPDEVRDRWRALRQGQYLPATHTAHFAAALE